MINESTQSQMIVNDVLPRSRKCMRADKYNPNYIYKGSPRQFYTDFWDWLRLHPIWVIGFVFGYLYYLATTEKV